MNDEMTLDRLKSAQPTTIDFIKPGTTERRFCPAMRFPKSSEPVALIDKRDDEPRRYRSRILAYQAAIRLLERSIEEWGR